VHQRAWRLLPVQVLLPAYWLLHTWAALRAARELIFKPAYWAKTTHGVTRVSREGTAPAAPAPVLTPRTG
jgi:hypothetical protein